MVDSFFLGMSGVRTRNTPHKPAKPPLTVTAARLALTGACPGPEFRVISAYQGTRRSSLMRFRRAYGQAASERAQNHANYCAQNHANYCAQNHANYCAQNHADYCAQSMPSPDVNASARRRPRRRLAAGAHHESYRRESYRDVDGVYLM